VDRVKPALCPPNNIIKINIYYYKDRVDRVFGGVTG
jgi:hypothetical protein